MATDDEIKAARERGDSYVMWSAILLLVVHLLIFPPLLKEKKDVNQLIGNEVRRLRDQRLELERDFETIERAIRFALSKQSENKNWQPGEDDVIALSTIASLPDAPDKLYAARTATLAALQVNAEKSVLLSKSKFSRELKIPGTDTVIDESQIRLYYPTALASWFLVLVFWFRAPLCRLMSDRITELPLWCGPMAYGRSSTWRIAGQNLAWFLFAGFLLRLFVNAGQRREFYQSGSLLALNLISGGLAIVTLSWLFIEAVLESIKCLGKTGTTTN